MIIVGRSCHAGYYLEGSTVKIDTLSNLINYYANNKTSDLPVPLFLG